MTETASIQQLLDDHKYSETRFAELEDLLQEFKVDNSWNSARVRTFEAFAQYFRGELIVHMRKEDEILYPALEEFLPRDVGPLMVLRTEHDDIVSNFSRMEKAHQLMLQGNLRPEVIQKFLFFGGTLLQILRDHAYKEERILFPMVTRFLKPDLDARIAGDMQTLARCIRENVAAGRP
jgi:iron-sulfur cluster repair protein YtfE (RIC family)